LPLPPPADAAAAAASLTAAAADSDAAAASLPPHHPEVLLARLDDNLDHLSFHDMHPDMHALLHHVLEIESTALATVLSGSPTGGIALSQPVALKPHARAGGRVLRFDAASAPSTFALRYSGRRVGTVTLTFPASVTGEGARTAVEVTLAAPPPPPHGDDADKDDHHEATAAVGELISRFTNGATTTLVVGEQVAGPLTGLASPDRVVEGLKVELPGNPTSMLVKTISSFPISSLTKMSTKVKVTLLNPFSIGIHVNHIHAKIYYDKQYIGDTENSTDFDLPAGTIHQHPETQELSTRPAPEYLTPVMVMKLNISFGVVQSVLRKYRGVLYVDVESSVQCVIGGFKAVVQL
ncbi:hypothetical protein HK405_013795, partial [Cladochytrium tenue]